MAKKISQSQIAKELGVSQSLVSIVLNGRKDGIAPATYEKIWSFAIKNGYSPKGMKLPEGMGDGQGSMKTIGYFLRAPLKLATKSNFFSHVTQGLHDYVREQNHSLVFLGSESDVTPDELRSYEWKSKKMTGIVIMGEVDPEFLSAVREMNNFLVYLSARSPGFCHSVNANEFQAAEQLVNHLVELGHREFVFFGGMCAKSRNMERLDGLRRALSQHGLELPDERVLTLPDAERLDGYRMAETFLKKGFHPVSTAVVCVNGLLARGVVNRFLQEGFSVGNDFSVTAFDNTRVCSEEFPGLTSASSIPEDLGREAGRILLTPELHDGDSMLDVVLPSKFSHRESSGPVPVAGTASLQTGV